MSTVASVSDPPPGPPVDAVSLERAYRLDPQVAVRPEPFGALCYHYGNRRLTFLTSPDMVAVVDALGTASTLADALGAAGVAEARWPSFVRALTSLVASGVLHEDPVRPAPSGPP